MNDDTSPAAAAAHNRSRWEPGYVRLLHRGELAQRIEAARQRLTPCRLCSRRCGVDRLNDERGFCLIGRQPVVSSAFPHHGEEDCLRGTQGSGTIFFSGCNLQCVFCQNFDISHTARGALMDPPSLAELMLRLQGLGCHNINLVTPTHVTPQILEALVLAVPEGLRLPLVYNCGGYEDVETLRLLEGIIDIYMPDFKFWDPEKARLYLNASDYPEIARRAVREMHRQVGDLVMDEKGLARRGLLVRHLVMPGCLDDTRAILQFLRELSPGTAVNVMAQYRPAGMVDSRRHPQINRGITHREYLDALDAAAGLRLV
ncbi:MAG: radical SAM protein [Verrucomicrobia bacterium]|nr:MAG: radical SAM protein [Verrucomicrobiota bacterium]